MSVANTSAGIPVATVTADCLPEAWEKTVIAVWDHGIDIHTQYDKPDDPPSRDATVVVTIADPFREPRIHKNFPGGPEELESYRQEVVAGIHDHWIDPAAGKWTYTYHERLFAYSPVADIRRADAPKPFEPVDQIGYIVDALSECHHTRRAQAITWMPTADPQTDDPPCLQRIWCRLVSRPDGSMQLDMNTHWRSRDLYKAWFMNVYALTDLQRIIAEQISARLLNLFTSAGMSTLVIRSISAFLRGCQNRGRKDEILAVHRPCLGVDPPGVRNDDFRGPPQARPGPRLLRQARLRRPRCPPGNPCKGGLDPIQSPAG